MILDLGIRREDFVVTYLAKILRGRAKCLGIDVGMATGPKEKLAGEQRIEKMSRLCLFPLERKELRLFAQALEMLC